MPDGMVTVLLLLYASNGSVGPYKYPGIGGTTCALYHSVSAAHSLHSALDASWKVGIALTQPSMIIEQAFVVTGVLYLLCFVASATCIITFAFLSSAEFNLIPPIDYWVSLLFIFICDIVDKLESCMHVY